MTQKEMSDEEFIRRYETFERESLHDFIDKHSRTRSELEETIDYLIRHREMLKDVELQRLEQESQNLMDKMNELDRAKLIEELRCFKEILAMQHRLIEENDEPRD